MIIDINCDLGEGIGNDEQLMPYITSCNIACGGHFGDRKSIVETIKLAIKNQVKLGAHPSFPDRLNFGRKIIDISENDLYLTLCEQISLFSECCDELNTTMHHIKLHGALYNLAAKETQIAKVVIKALESCCKGIALYVPYQSELARLAQSDYKIIYEAFADRRYHKNLDLVSRDCKDAVITNPQLSWEQISYMIKNQQIKTVEGDSIKIKADTYCVHGDQPQALDLLKYLANNLKQIQPS